MKRLVLFPLLVLGVVALSSGSNADDDVIKSSVAQLLQCQEPDGAWPYEGVYRVNREIPVGYRIGGTSIVSIALLHATSPSDRAAAAAIESGVALVLKELEHPLMKPSTKDAYDVRVWGHSYALEFLCRLRAAKRLGANEKAINAWIPRLVETLITEQLDDGGWNYASRKAHAAFVTSPVVQALLLARSQGEKVPQEVFEKAKQALEGQRHAKSTYYEYSGPLKEKRNGVKALPGSIARSAVSEATLTQLGGSSVASIHSALDGFHAHWGELEKRRKKTGTHEGPYAIAPYYFYYGHRYAAQAIELLPEKDRAKERERLRETIMKTRDEDGTWNDRIFPRSRAFGTAMMITALLGPKQPMPPRLDAPTSPRQD